MNSDVEAPWLLIGTLTMVLFGIFGITAGMAWIPALSGKETPPLIENTAAQPDAIADLDLPSGKCVECGIVESAREIWTASEADDAGTASRAGPGKGQGQLVRSYVLTVRMKDGARRQLVQPTSAHWQPGERVILIRGRADD